MPVAENRYVSPEFLSPEIPGGKAAFATCGLKPAVEACHRKMTRMRDGVTRRRRGYGGQALDLRLWTILQPEIEKPKSVLRPPNSPVPGNPSPNTTCYCGVVCPGIIVKSWNRTSTFLGANASPRPMGASLGIRFVFLILPIRSRRQKENHILPKRRKGERRSTSAIVKSERAFSDPTKTPPAIGIVRSWRSGGI